MKNYIRIGFLCLSLLISGCSKYIDKKNHVSDLYKFSERIECEYIGLIPIKLTDSGILIGTYVDKDRNNCIAYSNLNNSEWFTIEKDIEAYTYYVIDANQNEILFAKSIIEENVISEIYIYEIGSKKEKLIDKVVYPSLAGQIEGVIYNGCYYLSFYQNGKYPLVKYTNNTKEVIENNNCSSPLILNDKLYFIYIDNIKMKTFVMEYDIESDSMNKKYTSSGSYIRFIRKNSEHLLLFECKAENGQTNSFIKDLFSGKIIYEELGIIDSPQINDNIAVWWNPNNIQNRNHTKYTIFDLSKKTVVTYDDSVLQISKYGMVWVKFLKNENKIPKGEIFTADNSCLMKYRISNT